MADSTEVVVTWSIANWITVVLMVAIGFGILGLIAGFIRSSMGGTSGGAS